MRVWKAGVSPPGPGLTMSRSLGDGLAKSVGVIAVPEVFKERMESSMRFIVMASDGVWEVLESREVASVVGGFLEGRNANEAANKLATVAMEKWEKVG